MLRLNRSFPGTCGISPPAIPPLTLLSGNVGGRTAWKRASVAHRKSCSANDLRRRTWHSIGLLSANVSGQCPATGCASALLVGTCVSGTRETKAFFKNGTGSEPSARKHGENGSWRGACPRFRTRLHSHHFWSFSGGDAGGYISLYLYLRN